MARTVMHGTRPSLPKSPATPLDGVRDPHPTIPSPVRSASVKRQFVAVVFSGSVGTLALTASPSSLVVEVLAANVFLHNG